MNNRPLSDLPLFDIAPHLKRIRMSPQTSAMCKKSLGPPDGDDFAVLPKSLQCDPGYVQRALRRMEQTHALPVVRAEQIKLESGLYPPSLYRNTAQHLTKETRQLAIFCKQDVIVPAATPPAIAPSADEFLLHHIAAVREHVDYILHLLAVFDRDAHFQTAYEAWEMALVAHIRHLSARGMSMPHLINATHAFNDELRRWADKVLDLFGYED